MIRGPLVFVAVSDETTLHIGDFVSEIFLFSLLYSFRRDLEMRLIVTFCAKVQGRGILRIIYG